MTPINYILLYFMMDACSLLWLGFVNNSKKSLVNFQKFHGYIIFRSIKQIHSTIKSNWNLCLCYLVSIIIILWSFETISDHQTMNKRYWSFNIVQGSHIQDIYVAWHYGQEWRILLCILYRKTHIRIREDERYMQKCIFLTVLIFFWNTSTTKHNTYHTWLQKFR